MNRYVSSFIQHCHICQTTKEVPQLPQGDLRPLQIPERIWYSISVAQNDKALEVYLKEVERELNLLPQDTPG